jgi:hypothetical protein
MGNKRPTRVALRELERNWAFYFGVHFAQSLSSQGGFQMLTLIALVLFLLWVFGFIASYTLGGFIHILLVAAIMMVLLRVIRGKPL